LTKKLYILDNSILNLYNNNQTFNINGTMNDESFNQEKIILNLNVDDERSKNLNASCSSIKSNNTNYILSCNSTKVVSGTIKTAFTSFENENLLVYIVEQTGNASSRYNFYSKKRSSKLSTGAIIGIIISILIIIISVIFSFYYLKKKKSNDNEFKGSTLNYLKEI